MILETSQHSEIIWLVVARVFGFQVYFKTFITGVIPFCQRILSNKSHCEKRQLRVAPRTTAAPFQELLSLQLRESDPVIAASNGRVFLFHRSTAAWFSFTTSSTEEELLLASLLGMKDLRMCGGFGFGDILIFDDICICPKG